MILGRGGGGLSEDNIYTSYANIYLRLLSMLPTFRTTVAAGWVVCGRSRSAQTHERQEDDDDDGMGSRTARDTLSFVAYVVDNP